MAPSPARDGEEREKPVGEGWGRRVVEAVDPKGERVPKDGDTDGERELGRVELPLLRREEGYCPVILT